MTTQSTSADQIAFVDGTLDDIEALLAGLAPGIQLVVLDPARDGMTQIAAALAGISGLSAIHIISHGGAGSLQLGTASVSGQNLADYEMQLASIGAALSSGGDLLLYGCDVAAGESGQSFIDRLAAATGADVAASIDLTGSALLGGNWTLEASSGSIEAEAIAATTYAGTLGTYLGTSGNDNLTGSSSADYLYGYGGNDTLNGGAGADTMYGSTGNDIYYVDTGSDVVVEYAGEGSDWIYNSTSTAYSIYSNPEVEYLVLYGSVVTNTYYGYGNENNNGLYGNYSNSTALVANYLYGYGGNDTIYGYGGDDSLYGAADNDFLYGQNNNDRLYGGSGNDYLDGGAGNDLLDGESGDDTMYGGTGDDTYNIDSSLDFIYEYAGEGNDWVNSWITYTLGANFESLSLQGTLSLNATGNTLNNTLGGNSGSNMLDGAAGADIMQGLAGNDVYIVESAGDSVIELAGQGTDLVKSAIGYQLTDNVENLELTTTGNWGYGNTLANVITGSVSSNLWGSSGNDTLLGGAGADTLDGGTENDSLVGGMGNDTYYIDSSGDVIIEAAGEGTDLVYASLGSGLTSYTLSSEVENLTVFNFAGYAGASAYGNALANYISSSGIVGFNLSGGDGNDTIYGYNSNDTLNGGNGSDQLFGGSGNDLLSDVLENSMDTLDGGVGADTMNAGDGNDTYYVDNVGDVVAETYDDALGGTTDTVYASVSYTLGYGIENLVLTGTAVSGTGSNSFNFGNTLTGNASNNTLDGGAGNDTLIGGFGDDTYIVDATGDVITENSGEGSDLVQSSAATYTLADNVENLMLTGSDNIVGAGNTAANVLTGNGGDNTLTGGGGNDTIAGGIGYDTAIYSGNLAEYAITLGANTTVAHLGGAGSDGTDSLSGIEVLQFADQSYNLVINQTITGDAGNNSLPGGLGNDTISGLAGADTIEGDAGNDSLLGGTENDLINGGSGNDILNGEAGADTMLGGIGNDTYYVDNAGDIVTEDADEGGDTVWSYINYTLPANVETGRIYISGGTATQLTGNALDNFLYGSSGRADSIVGGDGNDYLYGFGDALVDTLVGGAGDDTYELFENENIVENASEGTDTVKSSATYMLAVNLENLTLTGSSSVNATGNSANNLITGNSGNNVLNGQGGADTMIGSSGDDTYLVDDAGDVVTEGSGQGTDLVQASVSFALGSNIENLLLTGGTAALDGTGNSLDNSLTGNLGANVLDGGLGADTMSGGGGNDTYVVDDFGDVVIGSGGPGIDTVQTTLTGYALGGDVENLTLLGSGDLDGTGNSGANLLTGNSGANTLVGDLGNDTLSGGDGDDLLFGGANDDTLDGGVGTDVALFNGNAADYVFNVDGDGIVTLTGQDGTDLLDDSIELLYFSDRSFSVSRVGGVAADKLVASMTPDYDTTPGVAVLADGGMVVSWEQSSRVHTLLINAYGQPGVPSIVDDSYGYNSDITALADGGYVVTYYGYENDTTPGTYGVIAKRFDASGTQTASIVVDVANGWETSVAALSNGGFAVAWNFWIDPPGDVDPSHYDIKVRAYGADNVAAGLAVTAIGGVSDQYQSKISALSGGGFVVTGVDYGTSPSAVQAQRFDNDGTAVGSLLRADPATNWTYAPAIAKLNDGGFVAAWTTWDQDSDGVFFQRFDADGVKVGTESLANTTIAGPQGNASVAGLANGGFVIAWESDGQDGSGFGIYAQRYGADGVALGGEFQVNSLTLYSQSRPEVVADSEGGFVITWRSDDPAAGGIYLQRYDASGATRGGLRVDGSVDGDDIDLSGALRPVEADGQDGDDWITGGQAEDVLAGGSGNDVLDGLTGADTFLGGTGDDIFLVDNIDDLPLEATGEGYDRVIAEVDNYQLPDYEIEELRLGTNVVQGTGNTFANRLVGNDDLNWLTGGGGDDTIVGGGNNYDRSIYSGELKEYVFGVTAYGQITVRHDVGSGDGTDTLQSMNEARFTDGFVGLGGWTASGVQQAVNRAEPGDFGNGYSQDSIALPGGNTLFAWYGSENGNWGTWTGVFDSAGQPVGQPQQISNNGFEPKLAAYANGAAATWLEYDSDLATYQFKTQRLASDGTPDGLPIVLAQENDPYNWSVAPTTDGGLTVSWTGPWGGSSYPAHVVHLDAGGVGAIVTVNSANNSAPPVLPDGSFLVFGEAYMSSAWHMTVQRYDETGTPIGGAIDLLTTNSTWPYAPTATTLDNGSIVIGWGIWNGSNQDAYVRLLDASGNPLGGAGAVHAVTSFNQDNLEIAGLPHGRFVAVWRSDATTQGDIYARIFDATGMAEGSEFVVNAGTTGSQYNPDISAHADGSFIVSWTDGSEGRIYQAQYDADGKRVGGLEITGSNTSTRSETLNASDALQPVRIVANAGNDSLVGGAVKDKLEGGDGNDTLDGGADVDTLVGGKGNDTYVYDGTGDIFVESEGQGSDTVIAKANYALPEAPIENIVLDTATNATATDATGNTRANSLTGNKLDNVLNGGAGADTMAGGAGNDTYVVDNALDTTTELADEGLDTVLSTVTRTLSANIERLVLEGAATINGTGNNVDNLINGRSNTAANVLTGLGGDDTYIIDASDTVVEAADSGNDTVQSYETYTLASLPNIENVELRGIADINATGNNANNRLVGNPGANLISGGSGNDTLDGVAGSTVDTLVGGSGDDILHVNASGDVIVENAGEGTDTAFASVSYALSNAVDRQVEHLTLEGSDSINGTGNNLANILTGNEGNNILDGGLGNDTLAGGAGDDTYVIDSTLDIVTENTGNGTDTIQTSASLAVLADNVENLQLLGAGDINGTGNSLDNQITGNDGANELNGGTGADTMTGGGGNDTYTVDSTGDSVVEHAGGGLTDKVKTTLEGYILPDEVEQLELVSTTIVATSGNDLANHIWGNAIANEIDGAAGADTMEGGKGDDIYYVDNTGDLVIEKSGEGNDTVVTSIEGYVLPNNIEELRLAGAVVAGKGNFLSNVLYGNDGDNTLDGGANDDIMIGGPGNDVYKVDNANDLIIEQPGEGIDRVESVISFDLASNVENLTLENIDDITLLGSGDNNATGNELDNVLIGNNGNNVLDGRGGDDSMSGGLGNDSYIVEQAGDVVTEQAGQGTDLVRSTLTSTTLGANFENLTLETGAITGTGNELDNVITGNDADNTLVGGVGDDTLDGGKGADSMVGGIGDDDYYVDNAGDIIVEGSNEGLDAVFVDFRDGAAWNNSYSFTLAANVEDAFFAYVPLNLLTEIIGNVLDNKLQGNEGANRLDGGAGADTMQGGKGDDIYVVDNASDQLIEGGDEGTDIVEASINLTLGNNLENLVLTGGANEGTGNAQGNQITGNASLANTLDGRAGADTMIGGTAGDTYYVDTSQDVITEGANAGVDLVIASGNYELDDNLEDLTLGGIDNISGIGNNLANTFVGNNGNNLIDGDSGEDIVSYETAVAAINVNLGTGQASGGGGNDTLINIEGVTGSVYGDSLAGNIGANILNGGIGADNMAGGAGSDVYYVDNENDVVVETDNIAVPGGGSGSLDLSIYAGVSDTVNTTVSYSLGTFVENLLQLGTANINGTGNALRNWMEGNGGNNLLQGLGDIDTLIGGLGNDTLDGGAGDDSIEGGLGTDTARFGGARANYGITRTTDGYTVTDNIGTDGTDTLIGIETLQFSDMTFNPGKIVDDFNGDGKSDILLWNSGTGLIWQFQMNGTAVSGSSSVAGPGTDWKVVGTGDYNGDGKSDILLRSDSTGMLWEYQLNGSAIGSSGSVATPGTVWKVVGDGDYNGDGKADILLRNDSTGMLWQYQLNGTTISGSGSVATPGTAWNVVGDGDYNGDGKADILIRNDSTGMLWQYQLNGTAVTASGAVASPGTDWKVVGDGDYNGDGKSDILIRSDSTGTIWQYQMNGTGVTGSGAAAGPGTAWKVVGDGDYNGDGKADILIRNDSTGMIWEYQMNGTTIAAQGAVTSLSADWGVVG